MMKWHVRKRSSGFRPVQRERHALDAHARQSIRQKRLVSMSFDRGNNNPQLARIQRLVNAARLEMAGLRPTDYELRRSIRGDLDTLLNELRASSLAVVFKRR